MLPIIAHRRLYEGFHHALQTVVNDYDTESRQYASNGNNHYSQVPYIRSPATFYDLNSDEVIVTKMYAVTAITIADKVTRLTHAKFILNLHLLT